MKSSLLAICKLIIVAFALAGCSATSPIVSEWRNPGYSAGPFRHIMVGALGEDTSIRRNLEDEFLVQLRAAGVDAIPGYGFLSQDQNIDEAKLKQAAQKAGADGLLFARSIKVEQKTQYGPSYFPYTSFGVFGSNVGASWSGLGGAPNVYRYNEYVSEITLLGLAKDTVVWTATIKTTAPEDVRAATRSYVQAVMKALDDQNLVGARQ
jgi:hypothetical protein